MLDPLPALEGRARTLEPGPAERARVLEAVLAYSERFLESLPEAPVFTPSADEGAGLYDAPLSEEPADVAAVLDLFDEHVVRPGLNPAAPGHLGYVPAGGLYYAALGDFLASVTNKYAGIVMAGPGAVRLERQVLRWLGDVVGYPATMAGDLTSGGSSATLSAVVTAREAHRLSPADYEQAVVYLTAQAHHCVAKALGVAGLKGCVRRIIPVDERYRMQVPALEAAVRADRDAGRYPWLVVGSVGTTNTGAVDPLGAIAAVAGEHGLWFHVDGAYGAIFALCPEVKPRLAGLERSDSLVMNPHKGLFLPYGSGAVLVRDGRKLYDAFQYDALYLQDQNTLSRNEEYSPADLSPELSRNFRGVRLWLPLKLLGIGAFRAALEEKLLLARYAYEALRRLDAFEVGPEPDLSVVLFRYRPERGDANAFNRALALAVQHDGRVFLSTTTIDGRYWLRFAVLSFRTHREHIDRALAVLQEKAGALSQQPLPVNDGA
jgi:glutamate/tyrosine decarboxylase-like PLP-dependent enzyme